MIGALWLIAFGLTIYGLSAGQKGVSVLATLVLLGLCIRGIIREAKN